MDIGSILQQLPHNAHYLNRYIKLISHWRQTVSVGVVERHHICPKSLFPQYKDGRVNPWNILALSYRQHFLAHWLLWKAYDRREMAQAFCFMSYRTNSSRVFAEAKRAASKLGIALSAETRQKMSEAVSQQYADGRSMSLEGRNRLAEYARNRPDEVRAKIGARHRGKTISSEMRAKQSFALAGGKNPRALNWIVHFEDGSPSIEVKALKSWCAERGLKYLTLYMRYKRGDNNFKDGIRIELKPD